MQPERPQKMETEQQALHFGKFSIFLLIKTAQNSYGIKGADYGRYRNYCSHKIFKLRKALGIKLSNKNKFLHKDISKQKSNDSKILQVLLFNAEKNWAFANQSKFSATRKPSQKSRGRFYSIKKLTRALKWARQLHQICLVTTDSVTQLEVQAYEQFLAGSLEFEKQNWQAAQGRLIACREIMSDLARVSDSLSEKVFKEKVDQIEQTIKFCNFKISKGKELTITEIVDLRKGGDASLANLIESLAQKRLSEIKLDDRGEIHFGSERYPIKEELIIKQKVQIDASQSNLQELKKKALASLQDEHLYEELLSFYSDLVLQIQEAIKLCDSERQDSKKKEKYTQGELEILKKVAFLFHEIKFKVFIDRNLIIFKFSYDTNRGRKSTPQTIAKLLTATMSLFQELGEVIKQKGQISNTFDIEEIQQIDAKNFYLRTMRLLFVGQVYFNNGKLRQAFGLWSECERCIKILLSKEQMNENKADDKFIGSLISLSSLMQLVCSSKIKSIISHFETEETKKEDISKKIHDIAIDEQKTDTVHPTASLETLITESGKGEAMLTLEQISKIPIIELPGRPQPIPTRPIFFDIFDDNLQYPDLTKKVTETKGKTSWWGRIFK